MEWLPYEVKMNAGDFGGDGVVTDSDVEYLLWHTLFHNKAAARNCSANIEGSHVPDREGNAQLPAPAGDKSFAGLLPEATAFIMVQTLEQRKD